MIIMDGVTPSKPHLTQRKVLQYILVVFLTIVVSFFGGQFCINLLSESDSLSVTMGTFGLLLLAALYGKMMFIGWKIYNHYTILNHRT